MTENDLNPSIQFTLQSPFLPVFARFSETLQGRVAIEPPTS